MYMIPRISGVSGRQRTRSAAECSAGMSRDPPKGSGQRCRLSGTPRRLSFDSNRYNPTATAEKKG
jgi:hypothetical protein